MRRNLLSLAVVLVGVPLVVFLVVRQFPDPPESVLAFPRPTHRVAMATYDALAAEMAAVTHYQPSYGFWNSNMSNGKVPVPGEFPIGENDRYFWYEFPANPAQGIATPFKSLVYLSGEISFDVTTRDGRKMKVEVRDDRLGEGSLVDCSGDAALAARLSPRIADRLAHPTHKHESAEDRAALSQFFSFNTVPRVFGNSGLPTALQAGTKPLAGPPSPVPLGVGDDVDPSGLDPSGDKP